MDMERAAELPSGQLICLGCGQVLDKVVASFAVLGWDDTTEDYSKVVDVGDFACPYCGEPVHVTKFYPPAELGEEEKPRGVRPFPTTYDEWVTLAEDIKTADPSLASKVNYNLGLIQRELPGEDEAKRWLVRKAGELNIT